MPNIVTVREHVAWSYANLARAHAAVQEGSLRYTRLHHMIRARLFRGLVTRAMSYGSLYHDERLKMTFPQVCVYCGSDHHLSLDHLIPRSRMGKDDADNLVWACRACNSSKRHRDMLAWMTSRSEFPSLLLLRRYLKIMAEVCEARGFLDLPMAAISAHDVPFALEVLPHAFPPIEDLVIWVCAKPHADRTDQGV